MKIGEVAQSSWQSSLADVLSFLVPFLIQLDELTRSSFSLRNDEVVFVSSALLLVGNWLRKSLVLSIRPSNKTYMQLCLFFPCFYDFFIIPGFSHWMPAEDWKCYNQLKLIICALFCAILCREVIGILEMVLMALIIGGTFIFYLPPMVYRNGSMPSYDYFQFRFVEWVAIVLSLILGGLWPAMISWWSFNYDRRYNFLCTSNFLNYISLMGLAYSCCSMLFSAVDISQHKLPDYPVMVLSATLKICALLCMKLSFERVPAHRSMVVSTAAKCAIMLYVLVFSDQFQIRLFISFVVILYSSGAYRGLQSAREKKIITGWFNMEIHPERLPHPKMEDDSVEIITGPVDVQEIENDNLSSVRDLYRHFMLTGRCKCSRSDCEVSRLIREVVSTRRCSGVRDNIMLQMIHNIMQRNKMFKCLDDV